ncbi:hypothetical protein SPFL3102_01488 [Sporomusaceae bacterium FL31]|nr:hypothetical protein SPFL3101_03121 [Sporomusaceae bacterium FL31]GCE33680.1 hypothetical protein SPFL3102_01488 [Sporomusaceae bacterium]
MALTPITLTDDPQQAVDKINQHNHDGQVGKPIGTVGISDSAITSAKLANGAITTVKIGSKQVTSACIADKTITAAQIADGVVQTDLSQTVLGRKNFIAMGNGMKFAHDTGTLAMKVTSGECNISGKYHKLPATSSITLPVRKACLVTAAKDTSAATVPSLGYVAATVPDADSYTVLRYLFNESAGNPQDSSANLNHITTAVSMSIVDGWFDRARSVNGVNGYMASGSNTGFPTGNAERQIDCIVTINKLDGATREIFGYGAAANTQYFGLQVRGSRLWFWGYNYDQDTGIDLEVGETYFFSVAYDGNGNAQGKLTVFINGKPIMTVGGLTFNTGTALVLYLGRRADTASQFGAFTYHYFEMRSKMRDYWAIAANANKALFPCSYQTPSGVYPSLTPYGENAHVYTFGEDSGTSIADSVTATAMNLTATGSTIVPSKIVQGTNARRVYGSTTTDFFTGGSYSITTSHTLIFAGIIDDFSSYQNIVSTRSSTTAGAAMLIEMTGGRLSLWNEATDTHHYSVSKIPLGRPVFLAITIDPNEVRLYIDSPEVDAVFTSMNGLNISGAFTTAGTLSFAKRGYDNAEPMKGTYEYVALVPKTLTQAEIEYVYSQLMTPKLRDITDDILSMDTISLGFVRTDATRISYADDFSYKYGRDEGASWNEGNKSVFLGWKYYDGTNAGVLKWANPLGNCKARFYAVGSTYGGARYAGLMDAFGDSVPLQPHFYDGANGVSYGYILRAGHTAGVDNVEVALYGQGGIAYDKWLNSFYNPRFIGLYAEVIQNVV